jgi:hypothetical protein
MDSKKVKTTQNAQKKIIMLRMAPADSKREKNKIS